MTKKDQAKTSNYKVLGRLYVVILILGSFSQVMAQQDAQYTQYMYNTISVNPAYAGSRDALSIGLLHRSQWVGLDGAPITQTFNLNAPVGYRGVGLGLAVVNDRVGPTNETNIDFDFSYTVQTSDIGQLSFGIMASAQLLNLNENELDEFNLETNLQIDNKIAPNFGVGLYYRTNKFYTGLSIPRILETDHFANQASSLYTASEKMHIYFITGYVWDLNDNLKFKPALLLKMVSGAPLQADISANFMIHEKFILGAAYRWDAAFSGMVGFQLNRKFLLGLAYDREITELGNASFNNGSFEIVLRYDFLKETGLLKSPRFF